MPAFAERDVHAPPVESDPATRRPAGQRRPAGRPAQPKLGAPLNNSSDFLPVREAFRLSLVNSDARAIQLQFVAADGYYLYRHRFQFRTEPADIALGDAVAAGEAKTDDYFGAVEVYRRAGCAAAAEQSAAAPFTLQVTYQGCADGTVLPAGNPELRHWRRPRRRRAQAPPMPGAGANWRCSFSPV